MTSFVSILIDMGTSLAKCLRFRMMLHEISRGLAEFQDRYAHTRLCIGMNLRLPHNTK